MSQLRETNTLMCYSTDYKITELLLYNNYTKHVLLCLGGCSLGMGSKGHD